MQFVFSVPESDAFNFQPDSQALQSILNNTGISFNQMSVQNTGRVTLADAGHLTPYRKARQSIREVRQRRRWENPSILLRILRISSSIQYLWVVKRSIVQDT